MIKQVDMEKERMKMEKREMKGEEDEGEKRLKRKVGRTKRRS